MTQSNTATTSQRMDPVLREKIRVQYKFTNIESPTYDTLKDKMEYFMSTKAQSYLKSELQHEDAEMLLHVVLEKNKQGLYEGHFDFNLKTGHKPVRYETSTPFKNLEDIIPHAFQHFKEKLSGEKKGK